MSEGATAPDEVETVDAALTPAPAPGRMRRTLDAHPGLREVGLFMAALFVYQLSRAFVIGDPSHAVANASRIVHWERGAGLFVELNIQQWLVTHLRVTELLNLFYMYGHWIITTAFFVWLYHARRSIYPYVRNAFFAANGIALAIFMVFPVAPPRMFSTDGFIDTLQGVSDIDLHGGALSGWFNPNAAVPSMHFGYAFMIGIVACLLTDRWSLRALALTYPALVFFTITGTANHYVVDALAGGAVMGLGFLLAQAWYLRRPQPTGIPALAAARARAVAQRHRRT